MSIKPTQPGTDKGAAAPIARGLSRSRSQTFTRSAAVADFRLTTHQLDDEPRLRQAELFYLQKQIQAQTPMVVVLEDGERIEGCIEWFDHNVLKIRGRQKTLVYKSAIKYMYKQGDSGSVGIRD